MSELFEIPESLLTAHATIENVWCCKAKDYVEWNESFRRFPLPDHDILFPWLHGVDGRCSTQNLFFRVRRSLVPLYRGMMLIHAGPEAQRARLVESFRPVELIAQGEFLPTPRPEPAINLRNFQNQAILMAAISDIFLMGDLAEPIAVEVVQAQQRAYESRQVQIENVTRAAGARAVRGSNRLKYKTIIITEPFSVFEKEYPEYVMYDAKGHKVNQRDLSELENQEMKEMSRMCQVSECVWVGNSQEVPAQKEGQPIAICIECHELGDIPSASELTLARETLNEWGESGEMIHLDMYGIGLGQEEGSRPQLIESLMNLLKFIKDQADRQRQLLIHCSDGYTESSVLVLAWLMYNHRCCLPEAYLLLQKKRPFFVYSADLTVLKRLERSLLGVQEPEPKRRKSVPQDALENLKIGETPRVYQAQLSPTPDERQQFPWFYSPRFEGSFPSQILPFLYLGNLNHATNAAMLKAIGITHVVSVGENADLAGKGFELLFLDNLYDDGIDAIRERLEQVVSFVEQARENNQACLIHCRVGVSRSAAVTIGYVMKHLRLTFVQAYLFVRARRLNVIIQPNLKFVYEMLELEQKETGLRSISWPVLCKEIHKLNLAYRDNT